MKFPSLLFAAFFVLTACQKGLHRGSSAGQRMPHLPQTPQENRAEGGVDVGNMRSSLVPSTHVKMTYPEKWQQPPSKTHLELADVHGSRIMAQKSPLREMVSPTAIGLKQYLESKRKGLKTQLINMNGLEGVRTELHRSAESLQVEMYLISEMKDFIHIKADLKRQNDGIKIGEEILSSARIEYKGNAFSNEKKKSIKLAPWNPPNPSAPRGENLVYDLTVCEDCGGRGVAIQNEGKSSLKVGTAGYDHGRIIEMGPSRKVPFDSIRVEGQFLIAPAGPVPLADIYTTFNPKDPQVEQDLLKVKEGFVYLVRTISWPEEDIVTKIEIEKIDAEGFITLSYERLVYVDPRVLQQQVEAINKYTLEEEKPRRKGVVTLYNRSVWNSYYHASFNFEFSTSGNMFITRNGWDLLFESSGSTPRFSVPHTGSAFGRVLDVGPKPLDEVRAEDFPDPGSYRTGLEDPPVIVGHSYLVQHYAYEGQVVLGAVRVLSMGPQAEWVQLEFRRVSITKPDHFQKWIPLEVPQGLQTLKMKPRTRDFEGLYFYPFNTVVEAWSGSSLDYLVFERWDGREFEMSIDSRPYGSDKGFYKLDSSIDINRVTPAQVEALRGKFARSLRDFKAGDQYAVLLEDYFKKTVLVFRVESLDKKNDSVVISVKYLERARAENDPSPDA